MSSNFVAAMDARLYPGHGSNWDDELFRERVLGAIDSSTRLLDLGAGAGIVPQMNFRGIAGHVTGVDPDPRVVENPYLDRGVVGTGECLPFPDGSFDVVVADNVLEHLECPEIVFREVARVLGPGGRFLVKTPNKWHYVATIARCTPHVFHRWINRIRGRAFEDTFPTRYRANTTRQLARLGREVGLELAEASLVEGRPEYLRLSPATYAAGWLYERAVNASSGLSGFRVLLVGSFVKRG